MVFVIVESTRSVMHTKWTKNLTVIHKPIKKKLKPPVEKTSIDAEQHLACDARRQNNLSSSMEQQQHPPLDAAPQNNSLSSNMKQQQHPTFDATQQKNSFSSGMKQQQHPPFDATQQNNSFSSSMKQKPHHAFDAAQQNNSFNSCMEQQHNPPLDAAHQNNYHSSNMKKQQQLMSPNCDNTQQETDRLVQQELVKKELLICFLEQKLRQTRPRPRPPEPLPQPLPLPQPQKDEDIICIDVPLSQQSTPAGASPVNVKFLSTDTIQTFIPTPLPQSDRRAHPTSRWSLQTSRPRNPAASASRPLTPSTTSTELIFSVI